MCGNVNWVSDEEVEGSTIKHVIYKESSGVEAYSEPQCFLEFSNGNRGLLEIPFIVQNPDFFYVLWEDTDGDGKFDTEVDKCSAQAINYDEEYEIEINIISSELHLTVRDESGLIVYDENISDSSGRTFNFVKVPFLNHEPWVDDCSKMNSAIDANLTRTQFAELKKNGSWQSNNHSYEVRTEKGTLDIWESDGYWYVWQD